MKKYAYQTFIGAKGVAFAWIGAVIGPLFLRIGLEPGYRGHLLIGIGSLLLVAVIISDGVKAFKGNSWSGCVAYAIVPSVLLIVGVAFVILAEE